MNWQTPKASWRDCRKLWSVCSTALKKHASPVYDVNSVSDSIRVYVDGADGINDNLHLIKGGWRRHWPVKKIVAACKRMSFVCIADDQNRKRLRLSHFTSRNHFYARGMCARELVKLAGDPVYREASSLITATTYWCLQFRHSWPLSRLEKKHWWDRWCYVNKWFIRKRSADFYCLATKGRHF